MVNPKTKCAARMAGGAQNIRAAGLEIELSNVCPDVLSTLVQGRLLFVR